MTPELSIVIPAYNEAERIHRALEGIIDFFANEDRLPEIVVVCDGCTDKTASVSREILEDHEFPFQVIEYQPNRGKGGALKVGMLEAEGHYRLFTDADLATPIESLNRFLPEMKHNVPIIFGSRKCPGAEIKHHQPWYRETMGKMFTALSNFILNTKVSDFTCGLKVFREDVAQDIFNNLRISGWAFDAEIVYLAYKYNYPIKEIPVVWADVEGSKVNPLKEAILCTIDLFRIRFNDLKGRYEREPSPAATGETLHTE